jgi:hypothetical protein
MIPMTLPISLEHVFDLLVAVATPVEIGDVGGRDRRVIAITGGEVRGPRFNGRILPGGADFQVIEASGLTRLHARYVMEDDAGARVYIENDGVRWGAPEDIERLRRGEPVDPGRIYFATSPRFETAHPDHAWMMRAAFVAKGVRRPDRVEISVYRVA